MPFPFIEGLAAAVGFAFLLLISVRRWLRTHPEDSARAAALALGAAGAAGFLLLFQNVLVHDALWYYSYLRSALVKGNFDLYEEFVLKNPNGMYLPPPGTPIFHLGTSLLQLPVALLVRPLAIALGRNGLLPGGDGYGPLEVGAATWTSMMLALGGVALIHRLARRVSSDASSATAQIALLYSSPLAFFAFVWPGYPHGGSIFLGALFLLVWETDPRPAGGRLFLLGLLGGLLALVHPQDVLYLALPLLDLPAVLRRWAGAAARLGAGAILGFAPQMAAWLFTSGAPIADVYGEIGDPFRWTRPALGEVLFSGYNGLVSWTPLCGVAIAGIALLRRSHPRLFRGLFLLVLVQWWAIASYGYWWGGASFGARYFLSAYPALGIGLAVLMHRAARRTGLLLVGIAGAPFIYWNLLLMAQFRLEWIPHNRPPAFVSILKRQLFDAPRELLAGLCGTFRWNQVLFLETLRAAIESRKPLALCACIGVAVLFVVLLIRWIGWLAGASPTSRSPAEAPSSEMSVRTVAIPAAFALAATLAVALVALDRERHLIFNRGADLPRRLAHGRVETIDLVAGSALLDEEQPTAAVLPASWRRVQPAPLSLDLISFLRNGESRRQGEVVAWAVVGGNGCGSLSLPLRAGIETAETACGRVEVAGDVAHDCDAPRTIQSWWQDDASARHYWGRAYLASWRLPDRCDPQEVFLRAADGRVDLEVRTLVVQGRYVPR